MDGKDKSALNRVPLHAVGARSPSGEKFWFIVEPESETEIKIGIGLTQSIRWFVIDGEAAWELSERIRYLAEPLVYPQERGLDE